MAANSKSPAAKLFNSPVLSDVKLKQICNGQVREYHAHKGILCKESKFFMNAFTGNFKEATENVMEIREDDLDYFEFFLKFLYTEDYDVEFITNMAAGENVKRILVPIGIYAIADKYGMARLYGPTGEDVRVVLRDDLASGFEIMKAAVQAHYRSCQYANSTIGKAIVDVLQNHKPELAKDKDFTRLMQEYTTFGAVVALEPHRRETIGIAGIRESSYYSCRKINHIVIEGRGAMDGRTISCAFCGENFCF